INGYQLKGTGANGENTIHAVKQFQSAHGLKSDGIVGPKTLDALKQSKDHPLINEAGHPSHGMYEQIKAQTDKLGGAKALGFHNDKEYTQALANMTWQARASGLTQVDHVVETANKQNLVMIQGGLSDPAQQREVANKVHAAQQPVTQSTQQLQQDVQQLQQQHHVQSQQQQMSQAR
ncbi:MAG: peptidoglycan-binding protein, partial [Proteobacteria bacterium]|nr:peptidoglycan-binding protein [Pseudomonadota bacterium]